MTPSEYPSLVVASTTNAGLTSFIPASQARKSAGSPPRTLPVQSAPLETDQDCRSSSMDPSFSCEQVNLLTPCRRGARPEIDIKIFSGEQSGQGQSGEYLVKAEAPSYHVFDGTPRACGRRAGGRLRHRRAGVRPGQRPPDVLRNPRSGRRGAPGPP